MRIVFMGTPEFAVTALEALLGAGHEVAGVFTRQDTPKNRGMKLQPPPVKVLAQERGIPVYQPATLKKGEGPEQLAALEPQVAVVAAYGLLLPQKVLDIPTYGCLNIHASLLPKYRGASPINAAILHGETETGVTIMQMDKGLDTGDMLLQKAISIGESETCGQLHDRLALLGGQAICEALDLLEQGGCKAVPQPQAFTYAPLITNEDCAVDFGGPATEISQKIRAYDPFPGAYGYLGEEKLKLYGAAYFDDRLGTAGVIEEITPKGAVVACGRGRVLIAACQPAGKKKMPFDAFLRGRPQLAKEAFGR